MNFKIIFLTLIISLFTSINTNSQSFSKSNGNIVYYDFELDYFPMVKEQFVMINDTVSIIKVSSLGNSKPMDLRTFIEHFLTENYSGNYNVQIFQGMVMKTSGMFPISLAKNFWIEIRIDMNGNIEFSEVFLKGANKSEDM